MEERYYLYGGKQSGWLTRSGYSSDIATAQTFTRPEALDRCRRHNAASNLLIPVLVSDMEAI